MALRGHASIQGSTDIPTLFNLQELNLQSALILIVFGLLSWPVMKAFCRLNDRMRARFEAWRAAKTAKAA